MQIVNFYGLWKDDKFDGITKLPLNHFHEYLTLHSLKSGGTKDYFRRVKVPGTAPYCKACLPVDPKLRKNLFL